MSKRFIVHLVLILMLFFLEISFFNLISPNYQIKIFLMSGLALLFIDCYDSSFWWFLIGGILLDLVSLNIFGLNMVVFVVIYLIVSYLKKTVFHQPNVFLIVLIVTGSVVFHDFIFWLTLSDRSIIDLLSVSAGEVALNLIVIWPLYIFFIYLTGWFDRTSPSSR
jgi:cell shape-determining protein MreD